MRRLTLFAKGNLDLRDSLIAFRPGGEVVWNGVNEVLRERAAGVVARVRHEPWARSDILVEANGAIPPDLAGRGLPLGAYPLASQFGLSLFETDADAYVLSIQPDVSTVIVRHRRDGYLLYPRGWDDWPAPDRAWLRESFVPEPLLEVAASMANFARIVERIRARSDAPILIYNVSSIVPGEQVHAYDGLGELLSTRTRRFNLGLIELSQQAGVSIIDVDTIVARAGADRLKIDPLHLTGEGHRLVAEEVVRVLDDLGCLPVAGSEA